MKTQYRIINVGKGVLRLSPANLHKVGVDFVIPKASTEVLGGVKTDADSEDPTVYLRETVDNLLASKANTFTEIKTINGITYTAQLEDITKELLYAGTLPMEVTIPNSNSVPFPIGSSFYTLGSGTGTLSVKAAAGVTLLYKAGMSLSAVQNEIRKYTKQGQNTWLVEGERQIPESQKLPINLKIGGVASVISTKEILATYLRTASGFNVFPNANSIFNFTIVGQDIECTMTEKYGIGDFRGLASLVTYFHDLANLCMTVSFQCFRACNKLNSIILNKINQNIDYVFEGCPITYYELDSLQTISGVSYGYIWWPITKFYFPKANYLGYEGLRNISTVTNKVIDESMFPEVTYAMHNVFIGTGITSAVFRNLQNDWGCMNQVTTLTKFVAPRMEILGSYCFFNTKVTELDFPNLKSVGVGPEGNGNNGTYAFSATTLLYLNIPNCKQLGATSGQNDVFYNINPACVINVHHSLKTNNNGGIDGDVAYAIARGCTVNFINKDEPTKIEDRTMTGLKLFANDTDAANNGVQLRQAYVNSSTGALQIRIN